MLCVIVMTLIIMVLILLVNDERIPKIIHQTAPSDESKWNKIWKGCQSTWLDKFPDWEYRMWTDEDIDIFVKDEFPEFYKDYFIKFEQNIMRFDTFRYLVLYKHGGLYADMDYECKENFESFLQDKNMVYLNGNDNPAVLDETCQNALMISNKGNSFWDSVIEEIRTRYDKGQKDVLYLTGPRMLTKVKDENTDRIKILPSKDFTEVGSTYAEHRYTATWK